MPDFVSYYVTSYILDELIVWLEVRRIMHSGPFHSPKDNNTQTQANSGQFPYPRAYNTQTQKNTGQFQQSLSGELYPYTRIPPPPPPPPLPPKKRHRWLAIAFTSLVFITIAAALIGYTIVTNSSKSSQGSSTQTSSDHQSRTPIATPTLDAKMMIHSSDFSKFLEAFAVAMANKDYNTIQAVTDTENFQMIYLHAGGGFGTWNDMYSQLITGNTSFTINYPPLTADQEGYSCMGYTKQGISLLNVNINADDVQYVVGTASEPNQPPSMQTAPDGTVFAFEVPLGPGGYWLWRAVIFNNTPGCN